jgi:hypothetical protein
MVAEYDRRRRLVVDGFNALGLETFEPLGAFYAFPRITSSGLDSETFTERLLEGPLPWTKMRQAYGLLRLCDRYGRERVDALCARAIAFDVIDVPRIERMLKSAHKVEETAESTGRVVRLPAGRFARDPAAFATVRSAKDAPEKGGE